MSKARLAMPRLIDISMPVYSGFPLHAPHPATRLDPVLLPHMPEAHGKTVHRWDGLLHTGTHVDAALELRPDGRPVDQLHLETFYGPAVVADLTSRAPAGQIEAHDLEQALTGRLAPGDRLLLRTDWSQRYGQADYFEASPYLSVAAAEWCVAQGVPLIGVDFQPVRRGDPRSEAKRVFADHDLPFLANLCRLDEIGSQRVTLIAFPLFLRGVEAAMTRAVVVVEN